MGVVVERAGSHQRAQAQALEAHIAMLSTALDQEDVQFQQKSQALQFEEVTLGRNLEGGLHAHAQHQRDMPKLLERERAETQRCEEILSDLAREARCRHERRQQLRERWTQNAQEIDRLRRELWRIEGLRDGARKGRRAAEDGLASVEAEVSRLDALVEWVTEQNLQLARTHVPLQNACSHLVGQGVRQAVEDYIDGRAYPISQPPSPKEYARPWNAEHTSAENAMVKKK